MSSGESQIMSRPSALNPTQWLIKVGVVMVVLAICAVAVDFAAWGPLREIVWQSSVVAPVERAWGFHAEWQVVGELGEQLVITEVNHDGPMGQAGVHPGAIIDLTACGNYLRAGGTYGSLAAAEDQVTIKLVIDLRHPEGTTFVLHRKHAT